MEAAQSEAPDVSSLPSIQLQGRTSVRYCTFVKGSRGAFISLNLRTVQSILPITN